jgi:ribose transport system substrate-binding protein
LIGTTAGDDREAGFTKEIEALSKANPGLKVVARQEGGFDAEKSFNAMTSIMTANPQIDAVFNGNDDNAVGALRAIRQANRAVPIADPKHIGGGGNRRHRTSLDRRVGLGNFTPSRSQNRT